MPDRSSTKSTENDSQKIGPTRRDFVVGCAASTVALTISHCSSDPAETIPCLTEPEDSAIDIRRFEHYRDLAQLDFFEIDGAGQLRCIAEFPPAVDIHVHLGFSYYNADPIDLQSSHDHVRYLFDCDVDGATCPIDLDVYANQSMSQEVLDIGSSAVIDSTIGTATDPPQETHTIPNLIADMDRYGIGKSVILPIALNFDYDRDNPSSLWAEAIAAAGLEDRLVAYSSVHPQDPARLDRLTDLVRAGMRGLKIHPSMQLSSPNSAECMELYPVCERLGVPVFFHAGRTGLEVASQANHCELSLYEAPVREFPNVDFVFGHSGAVFDAEATLELAKECENVWLCLAGPSIPWIETLITELGPERLLFGTDWPFYPQSMQLAKVLITTRCDHTVRDMILSENAERFLQKWS